MTSEAPYDVIIIGGGITGTALLFALANYTDIKRLALVEKYDDLAMVNSHYNNNSQTLHFGDIETNYPLEKAKKVKEAAEMMVKYLETSAKECFIKSHKMVLAVGKKEIEELEKRFEEFKDFYPLLKKVNKEEISKIEPKIVEGRSPKEEILALYTEQGYAVNYKCLAESFVERAFASSKKIDLFLNTKAKKIEKSRKREGDIYNIFTDEKILAASSIVVAAGSHSLIFAREMDYGNEYGIMPVAGSFYSAFNILKGKVYTIQIKKLPFASVHGDQNVANPSETRFGPTAKVVPQLERYHPETIPDFLKTSVWRLEGVLSLLKIFFDKNYFFFILKNLCYDIPVLGKWLFLQKCRKIIPSLKYGDLTYGEKIGGIRPQVVNVKTKKPELGEVKIIGEKIIFDITPSPGATVALKNAEQDVLKIMEFLKPNFLFDRTKWCQDFGSSLSTCEE